MSLLKVGPAGLETLATHCDGWSAEVAGRAAPTCPAASVQATAVAVNALHTSTGVSGVTLATRMTTHGTHLTTVAGRFTAEDTHDATDLARLVAGL